MGLSDAPYALFHSEYGISLNAGSTYSGPVLVLGP